MSRTLKIIIIITIVAGLIYLFIQHGKDIVKGSTKSCVDVPPDVERWQGDMKADYGAYGPAKQRYIGITDLKGPESNYVDAFFKAIDVQPHSKLVRTYSNEIKAFIESGRADYHWMITKGELRCSEMPVA